LLDGDEFCDRPHVIPADAIAIVVFARHIAARVRQPLAIIRVTRGIEQGLKQQSVVAIWRKRIKALRITAPGHGYERGVKFTWHRETQSIEQFRIDLFPCLSHLVNGHAELEIRFAHLGKIRQSFELIFQNRVGFGVGPRQMTEIWHRGTSWGEADGNPKKIGEGSRHGRHRDN
jgi:hypothetical protein